MNLIVFHHAGGDKYAFNQLKDYLGNEINVIAYELPGRNYRINEPFIETIDDWIADAWQFISQYTTTNYAILGVSMGCIVASIICYQLEQLSNIKPKHIFLASRMGLDAYTTAIRYSSADSNIFWNMVRTYDTKIDQLLAHNELKEFYEPILRADFRLLEQFNKEYHQYHLLKIRTKGSILIGRKDQHINVDTANTWQRYFEKAISIEEYDGGHFFIYDNSTTFSYIRKTVSSLI